MKKDKEILIFSPTVTNRLQYVCCFLFRDILGVDVKVTDDSDLFNSYDGPKFSYGEKVSDEILFFAAHDLLFHTDISEQKTQVFDWNNTKAFFRTSGGAFPFDPFAAAFYLVSRYEEYLPHIKDNYDRFNPQESLAYQNNFLHQPVIDIWAAEIKKVIAKNFPAYIFPERSFNFIPTIDVDTAYAYQAKGMMRTAGAYARSLLNLDLPDMRHRSETLLGMKPDPYDTFDFQLQVQKKYELKPVYFFLLADYGLNDKNVPVTSRKFQSLIKNLADYAEVGIHPSYNSNYDKRKLKTEIGRLSNILHREVKKSRQHFLKLTFPETYRNLIELEITDDYSMGYPSEPGFRAGTSTSFYFYDLEFENESNLRIHPFSVMEATFRYYKNTTPQNALEMIKPIIKELKTLHGTFSFLWHNDSLSNLNDWAGWKFLYEEVVKEAVAT